MAGGLQALLGVTPCPRDTAPGPHRAPATSLCPPMPTSSQSRGRSKAHGAAATQVFTSPWFPGVLLGNVCLMGSAAPAGSAPAVLA